MPSFGVGSREKLATCHPDLRVVFEAVVLLWDCTVLEGTRTPERAAANVAKGTSKTTSSKHLPVNSRYPVGVDAVDVAPFPLRWPQPPKDTTVAERTRAQKDVARYYYFAGFVLGIAASLGIRLRHGGDWDGDRDIHEQNFDDLVHFELLA